MAENVDVEADGGTEPVAHWRADPTKMRQCLEKKTARQQEASESVNLYRAKPEPLPKSLTGEGNLKDVIQAAEWQLEACTKLASASTQPNTIEVAGCKLSSHQWCVETNREILRLAKSPEVMKKNEKARYQEFLKRLGNNFQQAVLQGPEKSADGKPRTRNENVQMTSYYSPVLKASRTKDEKFKYAVYGRPDGLQLVALDGGKKGWRDAKGELAPTREEIENKGRLSGKELVYLENPLDRYDLQVQGSGTIELNEGAGKPQIRRLQFDSSNGRPNNMLAKIVRCELELRGGEYVTELNGTVRVKPQYLSGDGLRSYVQKSETPEWSKFNELMKYNESIVFFKDTNDTHDHGIHDMKLTPGVSLATDQKVVPFGFGVLLTVNGKTSFGLSQDTGGAIRGAHFDRFRGSGSAAKEQATIGTDLGSASILVPKKCSKPAP